MNKEELEIAKKIAEIEGVNYTQKIKPNLYTIQYVYYNPFDWSILGPLLIKYKIEFDFYCNYLFIEAENRTITFIEFKDESEIPKAILKCIIKSKE